jgi:hypothetical protein
MHNLLLVSDRVDKPFDELKELPEQEEWIS